MQVRSRVQVSLLLLCLALGGFCAEVQAAESAPPPAAPTAAAAEASVVPETLSLERAIALALQYNPRVAAAEQGVLATDGLLIQAMSALQPRLDVTAERITPVNLPPFSFQSRDSTWETNFLLSQPLYTGGSLRKGVQAAGSFRRGSEGAYRRTRQEIAFAVRQGYYGVLTAEEAVKVAEEVVSSAEEHLRVARLRYEAGVAPQFDVLAGEARVARVEQGLISARAGRDIAWAALSTVLGIPIPQGTQLTTPRPVTVEEADLITLRDEALANRPDLLAAEADAAAARAQLAIARAGRQPTVSAAMSYTLREQTTVSGDVFGEPGTEIVVSQNSGFIGLVGRWSLFNGGQVEGQVREAAARLNQAEKGVEGVQQEIELDVRSTYVLVEAAKAQVAAARRELVQVEEAHRIATIRYQEGVGTSVEILDAEANLEGAKTRLNESIYGLNLSVAQLDLALGRDGTAGPTPPCSEMESGSE